MDRRAIHDAREHLKQHGYAVVQEFVSSSDVPAIRDLCTALVQESQSETLYPTVFLNQQSFREVIFSRAAIETMEGLIGHGYVIYPNVTVRQNAATDWHLDAAFTYGLGGTQVDASFLQCAVYLQPNERSSGGGIDVVPGSHKRYVFEDKEYVRAEMMSAELLRRRVECNPGDLVVWDARLLHRSSPPGARNYTKFAIHWTVSASTDGAEQFLNHLLRRGKGHLTIDAKLMGRYLDIANVRVNEHIPPDDRARLGEYEVTFVTADRFLVEH